MKVKAVCPRCGGDLRVHHVMKLTIVSGDDKFVLDIPVILTCPNCDNSYLILKQRGKA